jgi:hypothetical protein
MLTWVHSVKARLSFTKNKWSLTNSLFLKNLQNLQKIAKICHNCLQYERVRQILYFHILDIINFWLNIFMDYRHSSNITKLKINK